MVEICFNLVEFSAVRPAVKQHLEALPSRIDSFLEDHILASNHYLIDVSGESAGFASIRGENLITQFHLEPRFRRHGQAVFARLRRLEKVQSAFIPTCDELFLSHAIDDYRQLAKQAYFFAVDDNGSPPSIDRECSIQVATSADLDLIALESGDFFDQLGRHINAGQIFLTRRRDEIVGFGIMERSTIYEAIASVGMYTIERFRHGGVGTATIASLIAECRRRGITPIAGCWYYNHNSKRTLEKAGMHTPARLLKIDY